MDSKLPPPLKKRKLNDAGDSASVDEVEPKSTEGHKESSTGVNQPSSPVFSGANASSSSSANPAIDASTVNAALEPQKTFATFQTPTISSTERQPTGEAQTHLTPTKTPNIPDVHINGISNSPGGKSEVASGSTTSRGTNTGSPSGATPSTPDTQNHMEGNVKSISSAATTAANDAMEVDDVTADHTPLHEPSSSDNHSHGKHYTSLHNHSPSHHHGHYHAPREPSSHHDELSEDEVYHPEHIRLRSAGIALYDDEEIDGLWDRLTKENQKIMFKQFLRRHPEHVGQLYVLVDRESNVTDLIKTKFDKINRKIDRCLQPNVLSWNDLEDSHKTAEAVAEYRRTLENRAENADLDALIKQTVQLVESYLDVVSTYLQRGKLKISLLVVATIVGNFSLSRACTENYLTQQEEAQLSAKFAKVAQRFLDNEHQPRAIKSALFSHLYSFTDKISSEETRQGFMKKLKEIGAPDAPSAPSFASSSNPVEIPKSSTATDAAPMLDGSNSAPPS